MRRPKRYTSAHGSALTQRRPEVYESCKESKCRVDKRFTRSTSSAWGTASSGQSWSTPEGTSADFSVTTGVGAYPWSATPFGNMHVASPSPNPHQTVLSGTGVAATTRDLLVRFSTDAAPSGSTFAQIFAIPRRIDLSNYYSAQVQIYGVSYTTSNEIALGLSKMVAGAPTDIVAPVAVTGITRGSSKSFWLRVRISGVNPTLIRCSPTIRSPAGSSRST